MPFKSQAQRKFMYSQEPELAKEFEAATPKGKKLPEHVKPKTTNSQGRYNERRK
jgi:hypothetical protein